MIPVREYIRENKLKSGDDAFQHAQSVSLLGFDLASLGSESDTLTIFYRASPYGRSGILTSPSVKLKVSRIVER